MTPMQLSVSDLMTAGHAWFACLGADPASAPSAEAKSAWTALAGRGYAPPTTKGREADSHHARGKSLYDAFVQTDGGRVSAGAKRKQTRETSDKQTLALRNWLRATHAEIIAIKRGGATPGLAGLPTLGELTTASGLLNSAQDFLAWFGSKDVLAALAAWSLGSAEVELGKRHLGAWQQSRGELAAARGSERTTSLTNVSVREDFAAWLAVWWAIAKVRLKDQPGVLQALGVETGVKRARKKPAAQPQVPEPPAGV